VPTGTSADLPLAPPPRVAKTKAELLVGRWQIVKVNDANLNEGSVHTNEYLADGTFHTFRKSLRRPADGSGGSYKVVGDTIHCHIPVTSEGKELRWEIKITAISATEAVFFQSDGNEKWVWHLKRLPSK
jgi:hypothetical protein